MRFWKCFHVWVSALSTYRQRCNSYWNIPLACSAPQPAASRSWPAARPPSAKTTFTMLQFPSGSARLCCHASIFCCFIRREAHPSCSHSIQGFLPLEKNVNAHEKQHVIYPKSLRQTKSLHTPPLNTLFSPLLADTKADCVITHEC